MKISVVSYINTIPFRYAIEKSPVKPARCTYSYCPPSECAKSLIEGLSDGGLIPVAAIPLLKDHYVFSDFCISANTQAYSVLLLSHVPIEKIKTVVLDYQSRSSVAMFQMLNKHYLNYNFKYLDGYENFETKLSGNTAGIVIGDRAMKYRSDFKFVYDIAELWLENTGLPAVFALWVSAVNYKPDLKPDFDKMMQFGIDSIDFALEYYYPHSDNHQLKTYLTQNLNYQLDNNRRKSVDLFLGMLTESNYKANFIS